MMAHHRVPTGTEFPVFPELVPGRQLTEGRFEVRFVQSLDELDQILRLRFEVFNLELGEGLEESFVSGRDEDEFDPVCHHLVVIDRDSDAVVGCYRLQTAAMAARHRGFYSAREFELSALPAPIVEAAVELGRACVARSHRTTQVLFLLWKGLALYVASNRLRYLFGCSSLTSQDPAEGKVLYDRLSAEGHVHREVLVQPQPAYRCYADDFVAPPELEVPVPKLFRAYLRHGARVCGPPAIDREFKTLDYLVLFDVDAMDRRMFRLFFG